MPAHGARLAIVIDDLGYNFDRGRRVVLLPAPVSLSILPFTPEAESIARLARRHDKDVLLHQPLESDRGTWADGLLTTSMTREAIEQGFEAALASVPFAIGINNHTGSRFTRDAQAMGTLMHVIRQTDPRLLFLDSRTTADTVAESAARNQRIPFVARDFFLDHTDARGDGGGIRRRRSESQEARLRHRHRAPETRHARVPGSTAGQRRRCRHRGDF